MRKLIYTLGILFIAFSMSAQEKISVPSSGGKIVKTEDAFERFGAVFSFDEMEISAIQHAQGDFSKISIDGAFPQGEIGAPELPVFKKMIAVPAGAQPKVIVKSFTTTETNLGERGHARIIPAQPPVDQNEAENEQPLIIKETAYQQDEFMFGDIAEINVIGSMREMTIGMLTVHPLRYNAAANSLVVYNDIEVEVVFENADRALTQQRYQSAQNPYFDNLREYFFNRSVYDDHPDLFKMPTHMLVVADRMFEEELKTFVRWKTMKGFYVDVHYTDEIGTTAAAIKSFCHQKYNNGLSSGSAPTFLILVGDEEQIPPSETGSATGHVTDLYYASVDGDYFPEMYYSRLSAENPQHLLNITEKILHYEQHLFPHPNYAGCAALFAGIDQNWNLTYGRRQLQYIMSNYINTDNGYIRVYFDYSGEWFNGVEYITGSTYVNYAGHCLDTMWSFPQMTASEARFLDGGYGVYFVGLANCNSTANFGFEAECLGEVLLRGYQRGAVSYIGSAAPTFWSENFHFVTGAYANVGDGNVPTQENSTMGYYDAMFSEEGFHSLGGHLFAGNLAVTYAAENGYPLNAPDNSALYYWQAYNILGDASLTPFLGVAENNEVQHTMIFPKNSSTFNVQALPGSFVAVSKDGVLLGTAVVGSSGSVAVPISPVATSDGIVDVVVTRQNTVPHIAQLPAAPASGPYIDFQDLKVLNSEGVLTYLSTKTNISIELKNIGTESSDAGMEVAIQCDDPQLTIDKATAPYAAMAVGESKSGVFTVSVDHQIENNKEFILKLTATSSQGSWVHEIPVMVYAPHLKIEKILIDNEETTELQPDTTSVIAVYLKNSGLAGVIGINGTVRIDDPYVSFYCNDAPQFIGDLEAGQSKRFFFSVGTAADMPEGHIPNISMTIQADYGIEESFSFGLDDFGYEKPEYTNCMAGDKIVRVKINDEDYEDFSCNEEGYHDCTDIVFNLKSGQNTFGFGAYNKNNWYVAWVDWNQDREFGEEDRLFGNYSIYSYAEGYWGEYGINIRDYLPDDYKPGKTRMRVRTRNNFFPPDAVTGWGDYGQTRDFTIVVPDFSATGYKEVENLTATVNNNSIAIQWEAPDDDITPQGYDIYRNDVKIRTNAPNQMSYTDSYLASGIYVYGVVALYGMSSDIQSPEVLSNPICLTELELWCHPPEKFTPFPNYPAMTAMFTWERPSELNDLILGYNIYRNGEKLNNELLQELTYFDSGLEKKKYQYWVTVSYKNCEESEPSNQATLDFENGIGIADIAADNFKIYPNPASNSVVFEGDGLSKVELFDLQGRLLATHEGFENEFVLKNLNIFAEGVYLVKMYSGDGQFLVKRLTVAR